MSDLTIKRYLDFAGLSDYDALIKDYISQINNSGSEALDAEIERAQSAEDALTEALNALGVVVEGNSELLQDHDEKLNTLIGDSEGSIESIVSKAVSDLVDGAPEALDTLKEIADWIEADETASAQLVSKVAQAEEDIANLESEQDKLKAYVDAQDDTVYESIQSIPTSTIATLFLNKVLVEQGQSVSEALANAQDGDMLILTEDTYTENIVIDSDAVIDAQGATFEGTITVAKDANVTIENAIFAKPIVVKE